MPERKHRPRVVVVGDLVVDVVLAPAAELCARHRRPRPRDAPPGRLGDHHRPLARSRRRAGRPGRRGRTGRRRSGPRSDDPRATASRRAWSGRRPADGPDRRVRGSPGGERSFVQDRGAALRLAPEHLREAWFASAELVHIPAYSLLDHPLGEAGRRAAELAHAAGALVTVDLSSSGPLLALGRRAAVEVIRGARPDLLFAAGSEAGALGSARRGAPRSRAGRRPQARSEGRHAPLPRGAGTVRRLEVAAQAVAAADTTGAGDAFDAGFILGWLARPTGRQPRPAAAPPQRRAARATGWPIAAAASTARGTRLRLTRRRRRVAGRPGLYHRLYHQPCTRFEPLRPGRPSRPARHRARGRRRPRGRPPRRRPRIDAHQPRPAVPAERRGGPRGRGAPSARAAPSRRPSRSRAAGSSSASTGDSS